MNSKNNVFTSQANMSKEERELQAQYVHKMETENNLKQQAKKELKLEQELNEYKNLKLYITNLANREKKIFDDKGVDSKKLKKFLELEKKFINIKDEKIKFYEEEIKDKENSINEYEKEITDMEKDHKEQIELRNKRILKARELLKGKTKQINNYLIIFSTITSFLIYTTFATLPVVYQHFIILNSYLYPFLEFIFDLIVQIFIFIFGDIYILLSSLVTLYLATAYYLKKWIILDFDTSRRFRY